MSKKAVTYICRMSFRDDSCYSLTIPVNKIAHKSYFIKFCNHQYSNNFHICSLHDSVDCMPWCLSITVARLAFLTPVEGGCCTS